MKTIIAGSRGLNRYADLLRAVAACPWVITEVVSGAAVGVDRMGEMWAAEHRLPVTRFYPNWASDGRAAGYVRNNRMAGYADALLAVWDGRSRGTKHVIDTMTRMGKPVSVLVVTSSTMVRS